MFLLHILAIGACLLWYFVRSDKRKQGSNIPTIRRWPALFPEFLDRLSYNSCAARLVENGYREHKDRPFRLLKMDMDLVVIPLKYAQEMRALTSDELDPLTAVFDDNVGKVTGILLDSQLHTHAIQRRLTPRLPNIIPAMMDELNYAFQQVIPSEAGERLQTSWVPINPYDMVLELSTRAAARLFVGEPICRDEVFLKTSAAYSRNIFDTIHVSRSLGHIITPYLGSLIPSVRQFHQQFEYIQNLVLGEIAHRKQHSEDNKADDFLQWCMELARTKEESTPTALAQRTVGILSMAVVHTSAMATTHLLFDMISNQELREQLRTEQKQVLKQGWMGITQQTMLDMKQLDSVMRESQRINPVGEFTFRRIVRKPITLSDGFQLHPGQQIAIAARCINTDGDVLPDAETFKPMRWMEKESAASTGFAHSSDSNLHFGLGRYACPGRFLASYMIKAIISRVLFDYEFKLQDDSAAGRPPNLIHGDKIFPSRDVTVLFRRRHDE
uniref:Cytochrome P450 monooxygenase idtP n=1 Tax=Claviceps paspali TaxID=40601 RepID=IDTP_CLAPA|nr:RecName: Full=Cytochrome P450 monooxygenase idtP; AltName: Full=Indole-diterpene biosynthesis cluster protein P; Flags: Precursor [Claviceps paspali]AFO85418.1 P450 monooxygenase [Claviceps paspali]